MKRALLLFVGLAMVSLIALNVSCKAGVFPSPQVSPDNYSKSYGDCVRQSNNRDNEIAACNEDELRGIDAELNRVYSKIIEHADIKVKERLIKSERYWLQFRDYQCEFLASAEEGGTIFNVILSGCRLGMTHDRIKFLKDYFDIQEKYYR